MLRVDIHDAADTLSLKLEGRLTGDDAENTRTLMTRCRDGMRLVVDLTEVTFIDAVGEQVLSIVARTAGSPASTSGRVATNNNRGRTPEPRKKSL